MAWKSKLLLGAAGLALAWPGLAAADPVTDAKIAAMQEQLELLQAQIADLKVSTGASLTALRSDTTTTSATIANGKPTIATSDGKFSATLHGVKIGRAHV